MSSTVVGFDLYENVMVFKGFQRGCDGLLVFQHGLWIWGFFLM